MWRTAVAPALSAVFMGAVAVYATSQFGNLIGNPESALRWVLPGLILVAVVVGVISAAALKKRDPERWTLMGKDRVDELDVSH